MKPNELKKLKWNNNESLTRCYVVRDDQGRYGIANYDPVYDEGVLFAHPIDLPEITGADGVPGAETLPGGALAITNTTWRLRDDGKYHGAWFDKQDTRTLEIVDDLGWVLPDSEAERVARQKTDNPEDAEDAIINTHQAAEYCREVGQPVTLRGLRKACERGYIEGARKVGRDWLMSYRALNYYLGHRPRRGRKRGVVSR